MSTFRPILATFIVAVALISCRSDVGDATLQNWNPEMAIPLVNSKFDIARVLTSKNNPGTVVTNSENVVTIVYSGKLFELRAEEIYSINDFATDLTNPAHELILENSGRLFQHLDLYDGNLEIDVKIKNYLKPTTIVVKMPNTKKDGNPFVRGFIMNSSTYKESHDLSGYKFDLTGDGSQSNNLKGGYESHTADPAMDSVELDYLILRFTDLKYEYVDGYLGEANFGSYNDSMKVDMFDKFKSGSIVLEDPLFQLSFENSFGLPIEVNFNNFSGSGQGGSAELTGSGVDEGFNVGAPEDSTEGEEVTINEINSGNSNLTNFLSISPNSINFELEVEANKSGDTTNFNFLHRTSSLIGNIDLELPLKGRLDSVIFEDEYDLDTKDMQEVIEAKFKLWTENAFPVGVYMQVYFLDSEKNVLDSLIPDNTIILKEAGIDDQGFSDEAVVEENFYDMDIDRFRTIKLQATHLRLKAMLLTDQAKTRSVKISDQDYFQMKLGIIARIDGSDFGP